ncbi:hypothetical protein [Planctomicrobium sp. SH664]|uniref:hypothetical protein n=1 Tax=Planctomicrobium sp. SH664 TaxID=3448125 RepID=UPI003F5B1145
MPRTSFVILFLLTWGAVGCSNSTNEFQTFPVSGTVQADGAPIKTGTINFSPSPGTNGASAGAEIREGKYEIPATAGLRPGVYQVQIRAMRGTGEMVHPGMGAPPNERMERTEQFIPRKYNTNTTLTTEIQPRPNENVNFELAIGKKADSK